MSVLAVFFALSSAFLANAKSFDFYTYEVYSLPSTNAIDPDQELPSAIVTMNVMIMATRLDQYVSEVVPLATWYQMQDLGIVCNFAVDEVTCLAKVRREFFPGTEVVVELLQGEFQD